MTRHGTRLLAAAASLCLAASTAGIAHAEPSTSSLDYTITSPYSAVDWSWTQYKA
ncbi:hypothetical protein [Acidipropionibacterium timonense]|uniref:hypothetical protein n=1 Tax=Acidipropionibacterium timonense TaxID=2161818 RepID=UPI001436C2CF|nr:hypothetical protein [Acidipropionibacterium timonense]